MQKDRDYEHEIERQIVTLGNKLATANEFKQKFKISSAKLDEIIQIQKDTNDKRGLGYEKGESSGSEQKNFEKKNKGRRHPVRQPNSQRFNVYCFTCNMFGHMDSQCRRRINPNTTSFSGQCFKCKKIGHKALECKSMPAKTNNIKCYTYGRFGHVSNQ